MPEGTPLVEAEVKDPAQVAEVGAAAGVAVLDHDVEIALAEAPFRRDHTNPVTMEMPDSWFPERVLHPAGHRQH